MDITRDVAGTSTVTATERPTATAFSGWLQNLPGRLSSNRRIAANFGFLIIIAIILQVRAGVFLSTRNLSAVSIQIAVIMIIAFAITFVMVAGHIDVSLAGTVALCGVLGAVAMRDGHSVVYALVVSVLGGLAVGVVNAILYLLLDITSLIATIATLYVALGISGLITNGIPVTQVPADFSTLANGYIGPVPIVVPIMAGFYLVFLFIEKFTLLGRHIVATGSNPTAAYDVGVKVRIIILTVFLISGAVAGFGGLLYASRIGSATPALDNTLLFSVIVACVVGGTSLTGGHGSITGTLLGAILIGVINNGLDLLGISAYWQSIALGVLLIEAVILDGAFLTKLKTARLRIRRRAI